MKLKGSLKFLSAKIILALFSLEALLFLEIRAYQALALIDSETGFFTDRNDWTVKLFFALAAVIVLVTPVLLYFTPLSRAEYIAPKKNIYHGIACLGLAIAAGYNSFGLIGSGERTNIVLATLGTGVATSLVLLCDAVGFFLDGKLVQNLKILNLVPVFWALCLTVSNFSTTTSYLNNTVLLINIFADAFLMLFFFQHAKKFSGIYGDGNSPTFIYSALICALLETSSVVTSVVTKSFDFPPYRIFAALFSITALISMLKNNVPDYVPVSAEEVTEAETADESAQNDEA